MSLDTCIYKDIYLWSHDENKVVLTINGMEVELNEPKCIRDKVAGFHNLYVIDRYIVNNFEHVNGYGYELTRGGVLELLGYIKEVLEAGEDWEEIYEEYFDYEESKEQIFAEFTNFKEVVEAIMAKDGWSGMYHYVTSANTCC